MPELTMINSRVVPERSARIDIDDWGFRYGWGAFDTIRVHKGCPLFLERHLARLQRAAMLLHFRQCRDDVIEKWREDVARAVSKAHATEAMINLYWTEGNKQTAATSTRIVRIRRTRAYTRRPARLWVAPWRLEPSYPGAGAKTLAYFPYIFAGVMARREGLDEALLLNTSNRVADCAASSIFAISRGQLTTPRLDEGTLAGITRQIIVDLSNFNGLVCRERRLRWSLLANEAEAVFIASALRGIVPVNQIGDVKKPKSASHPLFLSLQRAYRHELADEVRRWRAEQLTG